MKEPQIQAWWRARVSALRQARLIPSDKAVALEIVAAPELRDTPRHFAQTLTDSLTVQIHPDAMERPSRYLAILLHELGHVVEHGKTPAAVTLVNHPMAPADEEARADWLAERLFGICIYYDDDNVQTLDSDGVWPRPEGLQ